MNTFKDDILEKTKGHVEDITEEPPLVLFYNDDFTPKGFVVELLVTLFHKSLIEATELMWRVHGGERGVAVSTRVRLPNQRLPTALPWHANTVFL